MTKMLDGFLDVPGGRLYYEVEGEGPPVTLMHAGVAHLRMWDEQVAAWRDRYQVIRYDTRGFGRTVTDDVPYSNRDDLRRLLDHFGVDRSHFVAASRSGTIVTDFTAEQPDRVRSLVLVASGLRGHDVEDPRLEEIGPEMERLEEAREWERLVELETQLWTDGPGQPVDRVDPRLRRKMIHWNMQNYLADQQANQPIQPDRPTAERLGEFKVPTLVMWGTLDELGVISAGERMAREIPGAKSYVFESVAHMINLERPEEFNRVVLEFLDSVSAAESELS